MKVEQIEKEIYSSFADLASTIGYSEIHGRIIGALIVRGKPMSLKELAKEIGYSISTVSPSLDLLDFLGMIKRVKQPGDRNLYIKLEGDLLAGVKKAFLIRIQKSVNSNLDKFDIYRKELSKIKNGRKKEVLRTINILENDIKRVNRYINILSKLKVV